MFSPQGNFLGPKPRCPAGAESTAIAGAAYGIKRVHEVNTLAMLAPDEPLIKTGLDWK
jgi:hypothetical protein